MSSSPSDSTAQVTLQQLRHAHSRSRQKTTIRARDLWKSSGLPSEASKERRGEKRGETSEVREGKERGEREERGEG